MSTACCSQVLNVVRARVHLYPIHGSTGRKQTLQPAQSAAVKEHTSRNVYVHVATYSLDACHDMEQRHNGSRCPAVLLVASCCCSEDTSVPISVIKPAGHRELHYSTTIINHLQPTCSSLFRQGLSYNNLAHTLTHTHIRMQIKQ